MKPLSLTRPYLIIMMGISGAGKSQFANQFADFFKIPLVSRDQVLTEIFTKGDFNQEHQKIADRTSHYLLEQLLKTGQTIVFDGASDSRAERNDLVKLAKTASYETLLVWVQTDPAEARRRFAKLNQSKTTSAPDYEALLSKFRVPVASEKAIVISGKHTFASQLKIVLKHLSSERPDASSRKIVAERPTRNIIIR